VRKCASASVVANVCQPSFVRGHRHRHLHVHRHRHRHRHTQTHRHTDTQTHRHTNTHTHTPVGLCRSNTKCTSSRASTASPPFTAAVTIWASTECCPECGASCSCGDRMMIEASPEGSPGVCACVCICVFACMQCVRVCMHMCIRMYARLECAYLSVYGALCLIHVGMMYVWVYPCACVRDWCVRI
jgi:hypothetical protein